MNVQQMRLSEPVLGKLSQLALAVELHEKKRFSLRKDVRDVVGLLKVACVSANATVLDRLNEFVEMLSTESLGLFRKLGVELAVQPASAASVRTYRGQKVDVAPAAPMQNDVPPVDLSKAKKIIYRGKVIYR